MLAQPPFAKLHLHQESACTDNQAYCISAIRSQVKSDREIDNSADDRLSDIVCKTHFSVETQVPSHCTEFFTLIKQHER